MAVISAIAGAAIAVGGAVAGSISAGKEARRQGRNAQNAKDQIASIEENRQEIINPYSNMSSVTDLAADLSSTMSNPYDNLSVATGAAQMQAEEADISLANSLDTMLATGAGAGGATALAQMALKSKKGIAASIESQEATNQKMKAQGDEGLQKRKTTEAERMQNIEMQDDMRLQNAEAQGKAYEFENQEQRTENQLARLSGQQQQAEAARSAAKAGQQAAWGGLASAGGSILGAGISGGAFG
jgi:hypothetical protein|tara:strand:- start:745 stop:1473 length:729 start_codon:yes stop_codon:yes gene_type:complete